MDKTKIIIIISILGFVSIFVFGFGFWIGNKIAKSTSKPDHPDYEEAVKTIENRYQGDYPKGKIVMYGSSSFRMWTSMKEDLAPLPVLNHGFGGATLDDAMKYADRLVVAFAPKAVVIYCGTNDIGGAPDGSIITKTPKEAYAASVELIKYLQNELPDTKIYYIASSPQPLRWNRWKDMDECNDFMRAYCERSGDVTYIDTDDVLLDADGNFYPEYYLEDGLHFSEKGYEAWAKVIKPVLEELE